MAHLRVIGKNIHLTIGEKEILRHLMEGAGLTESEALDQVIGYKREQALLHEQQGNYQLSKLLLQQIDEWDGNREQFYKNSPTSTLNHKKIILPGMM